VLEPEAAQGRHGPRGSAARPDQLQQLRRELRRRRRHWQAGSLARPLQPPQENRRPRQGLCLGSGHRGRAAQIRRHLGDRHHSAHGGTGTTAVGGQGG